jgi:hypothetical protein
MTHYKYKLRLNFSFLFGIWGGGAIELSLHGNNDTLYKTFEVHLPLTNMTGLLVLD